jgi:hypothetical protein
MILPLHPMHCTFFISPHVYAYTLDHAEPKLGI